MTTTKRPHYVPKFYLNYFLPDPSSGVKNFWVYDKDSGIARPQTPINTAIERGFYSFETLPGARDDPVERKIFGPIEQAAKPILDHWQLPGARLKLGDVPQIAAFLAFMHTRVPRAMQMVREINEAGAMQVLKDLAQNPEKLREHYEHIKKIAPAHKPPPFEELRQSMVDAEINYKITYDPKAALLQSIEMTGHIRLVPHFTHKLTHYRQK